MVLTLTLAQVECRFATPIIKRIPPETGRNSSFMLMTQGAARQGNGEGTGGAANCQYGGD